MTDLETLIANTRTVDAALLAIVEAWTPDEEFNALLMQSYSSKDTDSIQELRIRVFDSFYTDDLIKENQKLSFQASNLTTEDYRAFLSMGISAENGILIHTAFQKKLQESLSILMTE